MNLTVTVHDTPRRAKVMILVRDGDKVIERHTVPRANTTNARNKLLEKLSERDGVESVSAPPI